MQPVRTYAEFGSHSGGSEQFRAMARDAAVLALSIGRSINATSGWIRFPYYHHVFDDERHGFTRQLNYLRGFGEFISLDDAVGLLISGKAIDGRYFCITFDDGFKNCLTNAVPILLDKGAPAAFFMTTGYIDSDLEKDRDKLLGFFDCGTGSGEKGAGVCAPHTIWYIPVTTNRGCIPLWIIKASGFLMKKQPFLL